MTRRLLSQRTSRLKVMQVGAPHAFPACKVSTYAFTWGSHYVCANNYVSCTTWPLPSGDPGWSSFRKEQPARIGPRYPLLTITGGDNRCSDSNTNLWVLKPCFPNRSTCAPNCVTKEQVYSIYPSSRILHIQIFCCCPKRVGKLSWLQVSPCNPINTVTRD